MSERERQATRPGLVLMTADTVGGVWTYAVELAGALAHRDVRVVIASMGGPPSAAQRAQVAALGGDIELRASDAKLEWMDAPWDDVERAGAWLLDLEREFAPDVMHLNQMSFGALPFVAPTLVVVHSCVCSWWRAVLGEDAPASWDRYRAEVARGLAGADLVGAPTRAMLRSLARDYGFTGTGTVLPNGRDPERFPPGEKEPIVFAAGRLWDAAKNLAALEAVAPALSWPVRVAGPVAHPDGGVVQARHVELLGALRQEALAAELARASIYALPARYEPFGLSVLEAALAGCALVLGDVPSLREIWGPAAVFVAPDDHDALRVAIQTLAADPSRRQALADAARARALTYTPDGLAAAYLAAYARLPRTVTSIHDPDAEEVPCAS